MITENYGCGFGEDLKISTDTDGIQIFFNFWRT